jgi:hydroxymethylpyrimidine pyrophosphatase-like HAD family hydrolase
LKRLFVADLDETVLSNGAIPQQVARPFRAIVSGAAPIVIATARGVRAAMVALHGAVPALPLIALDGSVIVDYQSGSAVVEAIPDELIPLISEMGSERDVTSCLLRSNVWHDYVCLPGTLDAFTRWTIYEARYFKEYFLIGDGSEAAHCAAAIVKIVFCANSVAAEEMSRLILVRYPMLGTVVVRSRDRPGFAWLEVGMRSGTKAEAVFRVARRLGYRMTEVVYYGDGPNDLSVMAAVGEAVAVANAVPEVLRAARRIIGPASSGAVVFDILEQVAALAR